MKSISPRISTKGNSFSVAAVHSRLIVLCVYRMIRINPFLYAVEYTNDSRHWNRCSNPLIWNCVPVHTYVQVNIQFSEKSSGKKSRQKSWNIYTFNMYVKSVPNLFLNFRLELNEMNKLHSFFWLRGLSSLDWGLVSNNSNNFFRDIHSHWFWNYSLLRSSTSPDESIDLYTNKQWWLCKWNQCIDSSEFSAYNS